MMKKVLSQREIDAILGKARGDVVARLGTAPRSVEPCNFASTGQMSDPFTRFMTSSFEAFARSVSNSVGALLRSHFEMALSSIELLPLRDFLADFQDSGFTAFLALEPAPSVAVLQVDVALVFPVIDVLLGGFGDPSANARELTEIDHEIMESVAQIFARQLEDLWQPMGAKVRLDHRQKAAQIQNLYAPTEKLAVLTFEAKVNETSGAIALAFPASLASAMLREMSSTTQGKPRTEVLPKPSLRARVLDCQFESTMGIPNLKVRLRELVDLRPGSVLNLHRPVKSPASLILGGLECFEAVAVRTGTQRAAQLLRATPPDSQNGS